MTGLIASAAEMMVGGLSCHLAVEALFILTTPGASEVSFGKALEVEEEEAGVGAKVTCSPLPMRPLSCACLERFCSTML